MAYNNVEVKITVKVDGKRVGRRKITFDTVGDLQDGQWLLAETTNAAVVDLAQELRVKAGV